MNHYRIATLLHPKYKLRWTDNLEVRSDINAITVKEMENMSHAAAAPLSSSSGSEGGNTGTQSASEDSDDLPSFMFEDTTDPTDNSCVSELETYLRDTTAAEPLQYWEENKLRFSKLFALHMRHSCVPATSAAIERCFSSAGYIASARRSRLQDCMLEDMLVARCNKDLI